MQLVRANKTKLFLLIILSFFVLNTAAYIGAFGENVPYWDEWDSTYNIAVKTATDQLTIYDLFTANNDHRIVFTNLLTVFSTIVWHWNLHNEMFVSLALACGCFAIVAALSNQRSWLLVVAAALIFSLRLEWLWAFMTQLRFSLLFILLTIWCLTRRPSLRLLLLGCISAICATYSFGYGLTIWPLGILLLAVQRSSRRSLVFWCFMSVVNIVLFAAAHKSSEPMIFNVPNITAFTIVYLGSTFVLSPDQFVPLALILGGLGIVWTAINTIVLLKTRQLPVLWLILSLYAMFVGAFIALGRVDLGLSAALAGRYSIVGNFFWIAGAFLAQAVLKQKNRRKAVWLFNTSVIGILIGFYLLSFAAHWWIGKKTRLDCVENFPAVCDGAIYPNNQRVIEALPELERLHLSFFAEH